MTQKKEENKESQPISAEIKTVNKILALLDHGPGIEIKSVTNILEDYAFLNLVEQSKINEDLKKGWRGLSDTIQILKQEKENLKLQIQKKDKSLALHKKQIESYIYLQNQFKEQIQELQSQSDSRKEVIEALSGKISNLENAFNLSDGSHDKTLENLMDCFNKRNELEDRLNEIGEMSVCECGEKYPLKYYSADKEGCEFCPNCLKENMTEAYREFQKKADKLVKFLKDIKNACKISGVGPITLIMVTEVLHEYNQGNGGKGE